METGYYLATLVFAVAALHLINRAVKYVSSYRAASGMRSNESIKVPVKRDDWYMFFHRSDLTGKPEKRNETKPKKSSISSSLVKHTRRDSRPALRKHLS